MFTDHAQTRCQQRGIPRNVVQTILAYGRHGYHQRAQVYFMDKRARRRANGGLPEARRRWLLSEIGLHSCGRRAGAVLVMTRRSHYLVALSSATRQP